MLVIDVDLDGGKGGCFSEDEVGVDEAAEEPNKRLLELVVGLCRDIVILQVLLPVERDLLGLHLAVLHIDFVSDEHNRNGLAHTSEILIPLGHVGVGDAGADVEHDDAAVAANVVAIAETTKFLLAGRIPNVENDLAVVREERHRVHLHSKGGDVLLFEFASQVALNEGSLADAAIADEDKLELWNLLLNHLNKKLVITI